MPTPLAELTELAKLGLLIYFALMDLAGKTPEEIKAELEVEYAKFQIRNPEDIKDV